MHADVLRLDLKIRSRATLAYCVGMALYTFVIVALYPQFKNSTSLNDLTKHAAAFAALLGVTGSLTSPDGWLNANIYENFFPLVILLVTIGYGAAAIAGQDEDGTLGLVAVVPVPRRRLLLEKIVALVAQALIVSAVVALLVWAGRVFDLHLNAAHVAGVSVGVVLLGVDLGLVAMLVGALSGRRGTALGVAAAVAAASYLVSSLAPVISWVRPLRYGSLFYWSVGADQISGGISPEAVGVLIGIGLVLTASTVAAFERFDLR